MDLNLDILESDLLQKVAAQCSSVKVAPKRPETPSAPVDLAVDTSADMTWSLPGFGPGARVATSFGNVTIEALHLRDPIKTQDGRLMRVEFIDTIRLDRRFLLTHPEAQPVEIRKNRLGPNVPNQTLLMSGAQKLSAQGRFDQVSGKVAADYIATGRAERRLHGLFTYHVFHCGEPCTVNINGMWIHIDPESLKSPQA